MYNTSFELNLKDLELIEKSLFDMLVNSNDEDQIRTIHELLGRLHQQKIWYRPKKQVYVGG